MSAQPDSSAQSSFLLVLDTNVCLDLFVFHDPRWAALLKGLQTGSLTAVTNPGCRAEWLAVLQYRHLPVTDENRPAIIRAFDQSIVCADSATPSDIKLPICTDPDDQQFMELARDIKATHLITKDKALLKCAKRVANAGMFQIMKPESFLKLLPPLTF
jgi:predicted nucleic acid-binding protein